MTCQPLSSLPCCVCVLCSAWALTLRSFLQCLPSCSLFQCFPALPVLHPVCPVQSLDFDFEKFCSVSLSNLNVYGCLVCGKYFQGRSRSTHAYTHSLEVGHHVFINLHTEKVYCLPEGYEVLDPSLDDIKSVLNPRCAVLSPCRLCH